jgi:outer membrane protein assembly factor BamB
MIGIISLFFITSITPSVFGLDYKIFKRDNILDNFGFFYFDDYNSSKIDYYDEYFKIKNLENVDLEEIEISLRTSKTGKNSDHIISPWPMKCHDNRHTSRSSYSTVNINGLEKWRFRCAGVDSSPVIGSDGTIYFGDKSWNVYAIYPNGTLKWKYQTGKRITSTPALADDGTLYVGSWDFFLYALNSSSGKLKWKFSAETIVSSPTIDDNGIIYFGTMWDFGDGGNLYAIYPDGTEKWHYQTNNYITSDPAIGDDGTIYIGSGDTYIYALNPDGTLKWRFKTGDYIKGPPSIAEDGTVYIGSFDDYLYALYPENGTMKWKCKVGYGTETNPSIASDGTIFIGGQMLYAINPYGTIKWSFDLGEDRHIHKSSPTISADGTIYIGTNIGSGYGSDIIAVNPDGTGKWKKQISTEGWIDSSPCIAEDGTVYIGSQYTIASGYIHAFGPVDSNSPPESSSISGMTNGEIGEQYRYTFKATDPDNNPISWYIEWGDGRTDEWTREWASDEDCYYTKTWNRQGTFTIRAKARDTLGEESDWAYLEVTMPRTRTVSYNWYELLMERFPLLERLFNIHFSRTIFNL